MEKDSKGYCGDLVEIKHIMPGRAQENHNVPVWAINIPGEIQRADFPNTSQNRCRLCRRLAE